MSVLATWAATINARSKAGELPTTPNRRFKAPKSMPYASAGSWVTSPIKVTGVLSNVLTFA